MSMTSNSKARHRVIRVGLIVVLAIVLMSSVIDSFLHRRLSARCAFRAETIQGLKIERIAGKPKPAADESQRTPAQQVEYWTAVEDSLYESAYGYPSREELSKWPSQQREYYRRAVEDALAQTEYARLSSVMVLVVGIVAIMVVAVGVTHEK